MRLYCDTSALAKFMTKEPELPALRSLVDQVAGSGGLITSNLAEVELVRLGHRLTNGHVEEAYEILTRVTFVNVNLQLMRQAAQLLPGNALRSLDAIHLASAMQVPDLDAIVTYDKRMQKAAKMLGIKFLAPKP